MTRALGLALALALGACTTPPGADVGPPPDRDARRDRLNRAETFAAVLSRRAALDSLARYDLVIVDPDAYQVEDVRELRAGGALSLGYVNVGEAEAWRGFADRIDPAWVLGENANWPGHQFVDARQPDGLDSALDPPPSEWRRIAARRRHVKTLFGVKAQGKPRC